jgi:hypothetical protein
MMKTRNTYSKTTVCTEGVVYSADLLSAPASPFSHDTIVTLRSSSRKDESAKSAMDAVMGHARGGT